MDIETHTAEKTARWSQLSHSHISLIQVTCFVNVSQATKAF